MRVHRLEITAFGPFATTQVVDFDALTESGLFLLSGPMGAGKTSILDAVCFGLYGEVPGDRNTARHLRSDHAPPEVAPLVILEVSVSGRRLRFHRSPSWPRPKRRGTGTVPEQARVTLEELVDGKWVHRSSRIDETQHLVTESLGMTVTQFCQVAMLPQGRFQTFLRARSEDRHRLLQQLFRTSRFEDVERWLVLRRQQLRAAHCAHAEVVASAVSRLSEAAETDLPDEWDLHDLERPTTEGSLARWAEDAVVAARVAVEEAGDAEARAMARALALRAELAAGHELVRLRVGAAEAHTVIEALDASQSRAAAEEGALDAARRAAAVAPLLVLADEARAAADTAGQALPDALTEAVALLGRGQPSPTCDDLAVAERRALDVAAWARALLPRERELTAARVTIDSTSAQLVDLERASAEMAAHCEALPAEIDKVRAELVSSSVTYAGLGAVEQAEELVAAQSAAAHRVVELRADIRLAKEDLAAGVVVAADLRERMHDIRESRINGMAAELATALAVGHACPVCGSDQHPVRAVAVPGAATKADEDAARAAFEDADFTRQVLADKVETLRRALAVAEAASAGRTLQAVQAELGRLRQARAACRKAAGDIDRLTRRIDSLERRLRDAESGRRRLGDQVAALTEQREAAERSHRQLCDELAELFRQSEATDTVQRLIETQTAAGAVFARARRALTGRDLSLAAAEKAGRDALACARKHGFASLEQVRAARLPGDVVDALTHSLAERAASRAAARAVLAEPTVVAASRAAEPDVEALTRAAAEADGHAVTVAARGRVARRCAGRLGTLADELAGELEAWAPVRAAFAVASSMASLTEGKSADNRLQMRLSAYVLAARLGQVVDAANERLGSMSDGRYALEHSARRGAGERRGGLSLLVRDEWTGESRDPATLSGGETFVASLALALGLADVVTGEAGGSEVDTLFVDEGFGALDPETLDDVMNTLDELRSGGRVVGVVSHVPEMRTRVPAQLQVVKQRSGSTVTLRREAV